MRTPAQIGGHPIHPMLVTIPIGLWVFSFVCDLVAMRSAQPDIWATCALYSMVGGVIGALAAALPGLVDLLSLKDKAIRKTAITHMVINLTVVALFAANAWMRATGELMGTAGMLMSLIAIGLLLVSGWLGGKMVYMAGVAVHTEEMGATPSASASDAWRAAAASNTRTDTASRSARVNPDRAMASRESGRETDRS